ncbi:MAG: hypothetical protein ACK58L_13390 [Planctomycetota bacterium]
MRKSVLEQSWFYLAVIFSFAAGHCIDLLGTWLYQPDFEHEVNPLYLTLKPYGVRPTWTVVICGKVLTVLLAVISVYYFRSYRRACYPDSGGDFRSFTTHFFYGRVLTWKEALWRIPLVRPTLLMILMSWSLGGPYYAWLGYENLAYKYGWWTLGGFWIGSYWFTWGLFICVATVLPMCLLLLFRDYQFTPSLTTSTPAER